MTHTLALWQTIAQVTIAGVLVLGFILGRVLK